MHNSEMVSDYKNVLFINLLQRVRGNEDDLSKQLERQFQNNPNIHVNYTLFDFHSETRGDNFQRLNDLMTKIEKLLERFSFFVEDRFTRKTYQTQGGIFRSNCLDCLDRTNVTQTKISMLVLQK